MGNDAGVKYHQGRMAARLQELADDVVSSQEKKVINQVMAKLNSGETLDPQFAIQQWLELYCVQRFRRVLAQRERGMKSAGSQIVKGVETIGE